MASACFTTPPSSSTISPCGSTSACRIHAATATTIPEFSCASAIRSCRSCQARPGPDVPGNLATIGVDTGYEIQIDEEARGDTRKGELDGFLYNRTGAVYKIKTIGTAPGQQNYTNNQRLAPGVWHSYDITVTDRTYEVLLNGQPSTKFTADPGDPNEHFRGRKKSEDPDSGFIGLQVHTGNVAFANIRIKT